jgi:hypothetical protein
MVCLIYQSVYSSKRDIFYNTIIKLVSDSTASKYKMTNEIQNIWKALMWLNRGNNPKFAWKDTGNLIKTSVRIAGIFFFTMRL